MFFISLPELPDCNPMNLVDATYRALFLLMSFNLFYETIAFVQGDLSSSLPIILAILVGVFLLVAAFFGHFITSKFVVDVRHDNTTYRELNSQLQSKLETTRELSQQRIDELNEKVVRLETEKIRLQGVNQGLEIALKSAKDHMAKQYEVLTKYRELYGDQDIDS